MSRALAILLILIAVPAVTACGGEDEGSEDAGAATTAPAGEAGTSGGDEASADLEEKPEVQVPDGPPPDELEVEDLVEGDGDEAQQGDLLEVEYVGVLYENGSEFDSSWERDEPFAFQLGAGMVIPGWDEGLEGMREGGRRRLTIPPDLAYGEAGAPPDIGPGETLVFVIDLVDLR
jgi:peptidylprolyl isomerase